MKKATMTASKMTYRDWLVGQALSGLVGGTPSPSPKGMGVTAIAYADDVVAQLDADAAVASKRPRRK